MRWADRLRAVLVADPDVISADSAISPMPTASVGAIGANGTTGRRADGAKRAPTPILPGEPRPTLPSGEPRPWFYPQSLPKPGDWYARCKGHRFWIRDANPGWRCWACHPPVPGWADVRERPT